MRILGLNTGLFPDGGTLHAALEELAMHVDVIDMDARQTRADDDGSWDRVLAAILSADLVVTV